VVLTDFLLANQSVPIKTVADKSHYPLFTLPKSIDALEQLVLSYQQNLITFEFTALHFSNPQKNKFAYRLQGQDKDWIYTDAKNRRATYTNLAAGDYTLQIKASNHHGYWNEQGKSLKITVTPAPWKTWWAYSIYVLCFISIMWVFVHGQHKKVLYQETLNLRLKQVDKLKDEFLANTSHELRTPLNGIIGLAESLIDGVAGPQSKSGVTNLSIIVSSGRRLSNLINDVLDFSKLKNRNLTLHTKPVDLHTMVEVVLTLSRTLVVHKNLELVNEVPVDLPSAQADENRLQQILHNLVGNAIKFTESGQITVTAKQALNTLTISVTDTGIGIDKKHFATLFDSFEQIEGHAQRAYSGTGLGLSVSKQLVELHGGTLGVESKIGQGSTFSFTLSVSTQKESTDAGEGATAGTDTSYEQQVARLHLFDENIDGPEPVSTAPIVSKTYAGGSQCRILVVDDEPVNRQVLHNHLSMQNYQLVEASGGEQALKAIADDGPFDLILLDVMMPKISGYEVCTELRKTYALNDLPIIFLTAKNQVADMIESFALGANDYLSKPISKHELLTRVKTHLKFLDIHRNLEDKVAERTAALSIKNIER
jgi:CheY-like chemotaxis protein/nitrogen-specific signal transduction histidine kinase